MDNSFLHSPSEVLKYFNVSERDGLSTDAVLKSRKQHGPNGSWSTEILFSYCLVIY